MPSLLILSYIREHPAEVAASLEGMPIQTVVDFFDDLPNEEIAYLIPYMSTKYINHITDKLNPDVIEGLYKHQPPYVVSRIFSTLSGELRKKYLPLLPRAYRWHCNYIESQSKDSITTLMTYNFLSVEESTTIKELAKALKNLDHEIIAVYTHDSKNRITGEVSLKSIFTNDPNSHLADYSKAVRHSQPPSASIDEVINLKLWGKRSVLPIIDHDQHILGIVLINTLFVDLVSDQNEFKLSIYDGAERLSHSVYSVLNSLAFSYIKKD